MHVQGYRYPEDTPHIPEDANMRFQMENHEAHTNLTPGGYGFTQYDLLQIGRDPGSTDTPRSKK